MIGDLEKATFSNIEHQSLEYVKYTLAPWICRFEQSMARVLLLPDEKKEYTIKFNVDGLLRGDYQSRMQGYAIGRQNGWMSANDIRQLESLDLIPEEKGGDLYLVNGNMANLEDAGAVQLIVTLPKAKKYLRIDTDDEDDIVRKLLRSAEQICMDVARLKADEFQACGAIAKTAVLYTVGYLYEHRDEADHKKLTMTLRSLLMGIRREGF